MTLNRLMEVRAEHVGRMRALGDAAKDRPFDEAEQKEFDEHRAANEQLERRIDAERLITEAERRAVGRPIHGDERLRPELHRFSLHRAIQSLIPDMVGSVDAGREREISQELRSKSGLPHHGGVTCPLEALGPIERRVQIAGGFSEGGALVPDVHHPELYVDSLRSRLIISALGATTLSGLFGRVTIPKRLGSSSAAWIAEDQAIGLSDPSFGQLAIVPRTVAARTELSRDLLMQSSPSAEQLTRDDLSGVIAQAVDVAALMGPTLGPGPVGLLNTAGVGSFSLSTVSWANVLSAIEDIEVEDAATGRLGWAGNPHTVKVLRSTLRTTTQTDSAFIMDAPNSLAGYPFVSSTLVPSNIGAGSNKSLLAFGNWQDLVVGYWGSFELTPNPYESSAYAKGNVQLRALLSCDVVIRHAESFTICQDMA